MTSVWRQNISDQGSKSKKSKKLINDRINQFQIIIVVHHL